MGHTEVQASIMCSAAGMRKIWTSNLRQTFTGQQAQHKINNRTKTHLGLFLPDLTCFYLHGLGVNNIDFGRVLVKSLPLEKDPNVATEVYQSFRPGPYLYSGRSILHCAVSKEFCANIDSWSETEYRFSVPPKTFKARAYKELVWEPRWNHLEY